MSTSKATLGRWFVEGVDQGYERMIIWCDTFDYEDYPEYTNSTGGDLRKYTDSKHGVNMRKLMEVYDLTMDLETQLSEFRAFHY